MKNSELSIVIPTLNERDALPALLDDLARQQGLAPEIIVADGGSADDTVDRALAADVNVVVGPPGRGRQMNHGAQQASAPWLLFLHADSRLGDPQMLYCALQALQTDSNAVAGHFGLRFMREHDGGELHYRYMEAKSRLNRLYTTNGDQGLLLARTRFEDLGGFDTRLPFLEDQRMLARLRERGPVITLPGSLRTSARRFEVEGRMKRYLLMAIIMAMHVEGVDAFFERAPDVYRQQAHSTRLLLTPYFRLLRRLMCELGPRRSLLHWVGVGRFILGESWQPCYLLDVRRYGEAAAGKHPALDFHDRYLAPLLHHRPMAIATALAAFLVVMGPMTAWYRWRERGALKPPDK